MSRSPFFEPRRPRAHQTRDRVFAAVFVGMVLLGVVSLYYSLNLVSVMILVGLVTLVLSVGSLAGAMHGGPESRD